MENNNKLTNAPKIKQLTNTHDNVQITSFDQNILVSGINDTYNAGNNFGFIYKL